MFTRSARFYDALYAWKDYQGEAARLRELIRDRSPEARSLLDVACGTGKHLKYLREDFEVDGLDLDEELLRVAGERLPGVPLHHGNMLDFDLGRTFDAVTCLFSSVAYVRTVERLERAVANMARHVAPGGVLVVEPFLPPEAWQPGRLFALFVDEPHLKIARMDVSRPGETQTTIEFHYLVGTADGIDSFTERHEVGLFTYEDNMESFRAAGLDPEHHPEGLMGRGIYIGTKPA